MYDKKLKKIIARTNSSNSSKIKKLKQIFNQDIIAVYKNNSMTIYDNTLSHVSELETERLKNISDIAVFGKNQSKLAIIVGSTVCTYNKKLKPLQKGKNISGIKHLCCCGDSTYLAAGETHYNYDINIFDGNTLEEIKRLKEPEGVTQMCSGKFLDQNCLAILDRNSRMYLYDENLDFLQKIFTTNAALTITFAPIKNNNYFVVGCDNGTICLYDENFKKEAHLSIERPIQSITPFALSQTDYLLQKLYPESYQEFEPQQHTKDSSKLLKTILSNPLVTERFNEYLLENPDLETDLTDLLKNV